MHRLEKWKLGVSKRNLLLIAALVWGFAGQRVFSIGFSDILNNTNTPGRYFFLGFFVAYFFFKYIFLPVFEKYSTRIYNLKTEKPCVFSFFNWQGYGIMAFMITFGVAFRKIKLFPAQLIGASYITIGTSLFISSLCFLYAGVRYDYFYDRHLKNSEELERSI